MSLINKKLVGIVMLAIFLFAGSVAFAQTEYLSDPGMLPDHPLYFMKRGAESVGTFFRFGDEAKANRYLRLSEKRLSEANALSEKENVGLTERTLERYQDQMNKGLERAEKAKERGRDMDEVLERVSEATLRHQEALAGVYGRVPEEAREGIQRAMEASQTGGERALNAVSEERREVARENVRKKRQEVEERLEGLRQEGRSVPGLYQDEEDAADQTPEIPETPEDLEIPIEEDIMEQPEETENFQQGREERAPEIINREKDEEEIEKEAERRPDNVPESSGR